MDKSLEDMFKDFEFNEKPEELISEVKRRRRKPEG